MNLRKKVYNSLVDWVGEVQLQTTPLINEELDSIKTTNLDGFAKMRESIVNDIHYLNKKLDFTAAQWKAWDLLNIVDSCSFDSDLDSKLAGLAPNSALIINGSLTKYDRGDILFKKSDNSLIHIPAESQGLYFPSKIQSVGDDSASYIITYHYATAASEGTQTVGPEEEVKEAQKAYKEIHFTGIEASTSANAISYHEIFEVPNIDELTFNKIENIFPVIRCYDMEGEIVECEFNIIVTTDGKYQVTNVPNIVSKVVVR